MKKFIPLTEEILRENFEFDPVVTELGKHDGLIGVLFFQIKKENQEWDIAWEESIMEDKRCVTLYNIPFEIYYVHQLQHLIDAFGIDKQIKVRKEVNNG